MILCFAVFCSLTFAKEKTSAAKFQSPFHCLSRITMKYGSQIHPLTEKEFFHDGICIVAKPGEEIYPIADGVVEETGFEQALGNYIIVRHSTSYKSLYAHLAAGFKCQKDDKVSSNKPIARQGATGQVTGSCLHLSIYKDENPVNPEKLLDL